MYYQLYQLSIEVRFWNYLNDKNKNKLNAKTQQVFVFFKVPQNVKMKVTHASTRFTF